MAEHPAGKGRRDDQVGIAELLARVTAQPEPSYEERVFDVLFELGALIVEGRR